MEVDKSIWEQYRTLHNEAVSGQNENTVNGQKKTEINFDGLHSKMFQGTMKLVAKNFDSICKKNGGDGFGDVDIEEWVKGWDLVAQKNGWDVSKSPEWYLGITTLGIAGMNVIQISKVKKQKESDE